MKNLFSLSFFLIIIITIIVASIYSDFPNYLQDFNINESDIIISEYGFAWPIPNQYRISSYFGKRNSPTSFASSFHYGIDIPANENTYFLASISGEIIYTGFKGSGGYTIILENSDTQIIYCHVSPNFLISVR